MSKVTLIRHDCSRVFLPIPKLPPEDLYQWAVSLIGRYVEAPMKPPKGHKRADLTGFSDYFYLIDEEGLCKYERINEAAMWASGLPWIDGRPFPLVGNVLFIRMEDAHLFGFEQEHIHTYETIMQIQRDTLCNVKTSLLETGTPVENL